MRKEDETWDDHWVHLAPSAELVAAYYGKGGAPPMPWEEYAARYRDEMAGRGFWIEGVASRLRDGETVTLLCSSACTDPARCHRTILAELIENAVHPPKEPIAQATVRRRAAKA